MSETPTAKRPGRPATGVTKAKLTATIDIRLFEKMRTLSRKSKRSLSSVIEECLLMAISKPSPK